MKQLQPLQLLPNEEFRIIKQVFLIPNSANNSQSPLGYILYERKFAEQYKMIEVPEEQKDFKYRMEYPSENLFPVDDVDNIILQAIKNDYPNSTVRSFLLLTNLEQERLMLQRQSPSISGDIYFQPALENYDLSSIMHLKPEVLRMTVTIFRMAPEEKIHPVTFFGKYDLNHAIILDEIQEIEFLGSAT